eukprot:1502749-Ditylum_brightwellii.AAC.1
MGQGEALTTTISLIPSRGLISVQSKDFNRCNYHGQGEDCNLLSESTTPDLTDSMSRESTEYVSQISLLAYLF